MREIVLLDIRHLETAEEIWALQHPAYQLEASLIGVAHLPPLLDTIETLQSCGETFWGYRGADGDLLGAISSILEQKGRYTLCRLMVHPDCLRQGIGSLLVEHLISQVPDKAILSVTAEARNLPAIALYERCGFVRRDSYRPIPEITMFRFEYSSADDSCVRQLRP